MAQARAERDTVLRQVRTMEADLGALRTNRHSDDQRQHQLERELNAARAQLMRLDGAYATLHEQAERQHRRLLTAEREVAALEAVNFELEAARAELDEQLASRDATTTTTHDDVVARLQADLDALVVERDALIRQVKQVATPSTPTQDDLLSARVAELMRRMAAVEVKVETAGAALLAPPDEPISATQQAERRAAAAAIDALANPGPPDIDDYIRESRRRGPPTTEAEIAARVARARAVSRELRATSQFTRPDPAERRDDDEPDNALQELKNRLRR